MNQADFIASWKREEELAHIKGWDFSHINDRYQEDETLPWDMGDIIREYLHPMMKLLDMETGGGEFLLSFHHPHENTAAIEGYPPNVAYCKEKLLPLGIDFREADGEGELPFEDASFDVITNRHGSYDPGEVWRVLKPHGLFITQQVGAENDRELVSLLYENAPPLPYPELYLDLAAGKLEEQGFHLLKKAEAFPDIHFYDVGALVWFARIIDWEFPAFSVDRNLPQLLKAQKMLEKDGVLSGRTHRYLIVARKG